MKPIVMLVGLLLAQSSFAASFQEALVEAALKRTEQDVTYDGQYMKMGYPNGDVPANIGVCTDVVIRTYRALGVDLQQKVHEDMKAHFSKYPSKRIWGLTRTDTNIDHRRVPNLQVFFERFGEALPITDNKEDYKPGDIVTWQLPNNAPHIGIVTDQKGWATGNPKVVHNIGLGPKLDDMLFLFTITGHYRYTP